MTTHTWTVEQLRTAPALEGLENVVLCIDWRCTAMAEDGAFSTCYGIVELPFPDPQGFLPYDQLTESTAVDWAKTALGVDEVERIEAVLVDEINQRSDPLIVPRTPPWC